LGCRLFRLCLQKIILYNVLVEGIRNYFHITPQIGLLYGTGFRDIIRNAFRIIPSSAAVRKSISFIMQGEYRKSYKDLFFIMAKFLDNAKKNKADEFYTQLPDIEAEMRHYKDQFRGKVIFCNCDDPFESNFFKYFAMNFNFLGLKKLISTCYAESPVVSKQLSLFDVKSLDVKSGDDKHPYKIEITEVKDENADGAVDLADVEFLLKNNKNTLTLLKDDGDFRSPECIELLKEADIVATNPPFSLFREYVAQLIEYEKKFIRPLA
jgi:hypothetical protein